MIFLLTGSNNQFLNYESWIFTNSSTSVFDETPSIKTQLVRLVQQEVKMAQNTFAFLSNSNSEIMHETFPNVDFLCIPCTLQKDSISSLGLPSSLIFPYPVLL